MVIDPALNALGNTEAQRALQERSRGSGHRRRASPGGQRGFLDRGRYRNRALSHERHGSTGDRRRLAESWGIDTELQEVPRTLRVALPPVLHAHRQSGEEVHQAWRRSSRAGHPKRSSRTSLRSSAGFNPLLICRSWWTYELLQTRLFDRTAETGTIGFLQLTG